MLHLQRFLYCTTSLRISFFLEIASSILVFGQVRTGGLRSIFFLPIASPFYVRISLVAALAFWKGFSSRSLQKIRSYFEL